MRARLSNFGASKVSGYLVISAVVLIWAGFALTLRAIGKSPLSAADVGLIRFTVPALCLLPFLRSYLAQLRRVRFRDLLLVLLGGVPFFLVASAGARSTSTAHVSALIAGTAPLSVALISFLLEKSAIPKKRWFALGLIALGAVGMIATQPAGGSHSDPWGCLTLLFASLLWGAYTVGVRRAGLDAIANALILTVLSLMILGALSLVGVTESHLGQFSWREALPFVLVQGLGVGLIATVGYSFAIGRLGSSRSAVIGSLAPGLSAVLAVFIFGEALNFATLACIAVLTLGVILANRSLGKN
ncbi:DMT family transporter [Roseibacillus persicicus]|uniref:DMT family transporter n=1 Tax=Roseibacillus persicicus TaxID=454148 RepID=UPI00398AA18E